MFRCLIHLFNKLIKEAMTGQLLKYCLSETFPSSLILFARYSVVKTRETSLKAHYGRGLYIVLTLTEQTYRPAGQDERGVPRKTNEGVWGVFMGANMN